MGCVTHQFYDFLKKGKIMGFKCRHCGQVSLPPRDICSGCGGFDMDWVQLSGKGSLLFASAGTHRLLGLDFIQGTVKLEEGPVIPGRILIEDFDFSTPEKIWEYNRAGLPVIAEVVMNPLGVGSIAFRIDGQVS